MVSTRPRHITPLDTRVSNHPYRNWKRNWTMIENGRCACHRSGLLVRCDGDGVRVDEESRAKVCAQMASDEGNQRHIGSHILKLTAQAEQLFRKRP